MGDADIIYVNIPIPILPVKHKRTWSRVKLAKLQTLKAATCTLSIINLKKMHQLELYLNVTIKTL